MSRAREMPMATREPRRTRALLLGAVLLLHAGLVGWLQHASHRAAPHRDQARSSVRMITIQLPPLPAPKSKPTPIVARTSPSTRPAPAVRTEVPMRPRAIARPDAEPPPDEPRSTLVVEAPAPRASSASGPSGRDLMYGAATQRALRQSTQGQPLLSERADQASLAPDKIDASTRLGKEMMKGATGDCLKGEFAGGGAGLLSAPFWLLAEARGKCRR